MLNERGGRIVFRFHARAVNLVLRPHTPGTAVAFRVLVAEEPPDDASGLNVDEQAHGTIVQERLYQLIRQRGPVADQTFEIGFLDPGVEA